MDNKTIRFIDSDYRELFTIPDGANIVINRYDGEKVVVRCEYIDEYHTQIGNDCYHICQFAEMMEKNGNTYEPQEQIEKTEISVGAADERLMFYRNKNDITSIGQMSGEFGNDGTRFFTNWSDYDNGLKTPEFQNEFQYVMYELRKDMLKDYNSMAAYCYKNPDAKLPGETYRYGFKTETKNHKYYIRLTTLKQDDFYVFCYRKDPVKDRVEKNHAFVEKNAAEFDKNKIYLDYDMKLYKEVYYNPDSDAGGQLVHNEIPFDLFKYAFNNSKSDNEFWDYVDTLAYQTLTDINTPEFAEDAKLFVETPCDFTGRSQELLDVIKNLTEPVREIPETDKDIEERWESYTSITKEFALKMYDSGYPVYVDYDLVKIRNQIENAAEDGLKAPDVNQYISDVKDKNRNDKKMTLSDRLYQKVEQEYNDFIDELKQLPPEKMIEKSYEKVIKEDIVGCVMENLPHYKAKALLSLEHPLEEIYQSWLGNDYSYLDILRDTIDDTAKHAKQQMKNEKVKEKSEKNER